MPYVSRAPSTLHARLEIARELTRAVPAGVERHFESAHVPRHVRSVEHHLGEPAERRLAGDEVRPQPRRRGGSVGGNVAFEARAGDRHCKRRGELARDDAKAGAQVAHVARYARPVRDAQLYVGIDERQPLRIEVGPLEIAEGFGKGLHLHCLGTGCGCRKGAQVELGNRQPAGELRARAARIKREIARNGGGSDYSVHRVQRGGAGRHVELACDCRCANAAEAGCPAAAPTSRVSAVPAPNTIRATGG